MFKPWPEGVLYVFIYRIYRIVNSYTVGYTSFLWCQNEWRHTLFFCLTCFVCRVVGWQRAVMWLGSGNRSVYQQKTSRKPKSCKTNSSDIFSLEISTFHKSNSKDNRIKKYRYGSIAIDTIFSGMNIHLPAILGFTRYQGFDPSPYNNINNTHKYTLSNIYAFAFAQVACSCRQDPVPGDAIRGWWHEKMDGSLWLKDVKRTFRDI
jgi:hypothetical protein